MGLPALIAANPQLALTAGSILAKLGAGFTGRNDQRDARRKAEEENKRRIGRANLSRAFGGNPAVDLVNPKLKQSGATKLLSGLGTAASLGAQAVGMHSQAKAAKQAFDSRAIQNEAAQFNLAKGRGALAGSAASLAEGSADKFSNAIPPLGGADQIGAVPKTLDKFAAPPSQFTGGAPKLSGLTGTPEAASRISNFSDPSGVMASIAGLSDTGKLAAQATVNQRQEQRGLLDAAQIQSDLENRQAEDRIDISREELQQRDTQFKETNNTRWLISEGNNRAKLIIARMKENGVSITDMTDKVKLKGLLDKGANDMSSVKMLNQMRPRYDSMNAIMADWKAGGTLTGTDQIAIFTSFQRFIDDAVVRSDDVNLQLLAQNLWQSSLAKLNNMTEGDVVSEDLILNMERAADAMFKANTLAAKEAIGGYYDGYDGLGISADFLENSRSTVETAAFGGSAAGGAAVKTPSGQLIDESIRDNTLNKAEQGDDTARNQLMLWGYVSNG